MMKSIACILSLGFAIAATLAQSPNFDYPYLVHCDQGYILEENQYLSPEVGDWDDDGDLDLMVGVYYDGNIFYYENIATTTEPQYSEGVVVEADGQPIQVTYG